MPRMWHLIRRNGTYWFKADLPDDLAGKPFPGTLPETLKLLESPKRSGHFKAAIWKSLRTAEEREAKRKAGLEIALHEAMFDSAREFLSQRPHQECSPEKAQAMAEEYRRMMLTINEVQRQQGLGVAERVKIPDDVKLPSSSGMSELDFGPIRDGSSSATTRPGRRSPASVSPRVCGRRRMPHRC